MRKLVSLMIFPVLFMAAEASAEPMAGADIQAKIIGHSFDVRRMGMRVRMTHSTGGDVTLSSALFEGEGTWTVVGDELCVNIIKGPRKGENCVTLTDLGSGSYRTSDGVTLNAAQ